MHDAERVEAAMLPRPAGSLVGSVKVGVTSFAGVAAAFHRVSHVRFRQSSKRTTAKQWLGRGNLADWPFGNKASRSATLRGERYWYVFQQYLRAVCADILIDLSERANAQYDVVYVRGI